MTVLSTVFMVMVGILCCVIGVMNIMGNVSTIKWRQRRYVAEEDLAAFGKLVGVGTVAIGVAILLFSLFQGIATAIASPLLELIGAILLLIGAAIGVALTMYATFKYNRRPK